MVLIGQKTNEVDYWKNSDQKQPVVSCSTTGYRAEIEEVKGYRYLPQLRIAIQREMERRKVIQEQVKDAA